MMKKLFATLSAVALMAGAVTAQAAGDAEAGKAKTAVCAGCHGADGKGNIALGAPNLTDNIWLHGGSRTAIADTIRNGRTGEMPAHNDILGEAKSHLVSAYVYSLSNK